MNEDVHGTNVTFHHKKINGITIAKMVNFMVKVCMKFPYEHVVSSNYPIRSRSCIIYRAAVCRYSGKNRLSGDGKKQCSYYYYYYYYTNNDDDNKNDDNKNDDDNNDDDDDNNDDDDNDDNNDEDNNNDDDNDNNNNTGKGVLGSR